MEHESLVEEIKGSMSELNVPGVAVGIMHGEETFTAGLGVTSVDHPLPVDDSTLFQIGSITKTFVGTLAMRLVETGKIELDAPIRSYLPGFRVQDEGASEGATMRHLLTHTAGWVGDWFPEDLGHGDDAVARYVESMAETPQLTRSSPTTTQGSTSPAGSSRPSWGRASRRSCRRQSWTPWGWATPTSSPGT